MPIATASAARKLVIRQLYFAPAIFQSDYPTPKEAKMSKDYSRLR
jgi:hypothetical protein